MAWIAPKINWRQGDAPTERDFNRIEANELDLYNRIAPLNTYTTDTRNIVNAAIAQLSAVVSYTVPVSAWAAYTSANMNYSFRAQISNNNVVATSRVDVEILAANAIDAYIFGIYPFTDTGNRVFYMYADAKPSNSIAIKYVVFKGA